MNTYTHTYNTYILNKVGKLNTTAVYVCVYTYVKHTQTHTHTYEYMHIHIYNTHILNRSSNERPLRYMHVYT